MMIDVIHTHVCLSQGRALEDIDDLFSKVLNRQNSHENEGQSEIAIAYHVDDG